MRRAAAKKTPAQSAKAQPKAHSKAQERKELEELKAFQDETPRGKNVRPKEDAAELNEVLDDVAKSAPEEGDSVESEFAKLGEKDRTAFHNKLLLRRFLIEARGFWSRQGDRLAWFLTIGLLVLILANLAAQYGINVWNRKIFDALEKRDAQTVLFYSMIFFPLAIASVSCGVVNVYARMTLQRRWRSWITSRVLNHWLANGRYFQLNLVSGDHKNPEGRIAEDLRIATDAPVDFAVGVTSAALSALTFIAVLWNIGGALTLPVGGTTITIPGFLVVAAILYAVIASGLMVRVGRSFVSVSEAKNQAEADYRYILTRVRENGESIAILGGEEEERAGVDRAMIAVLKRWRDLCRQHMKTTVVSQGSGIIAPVVPIILAAPKFLNNEMSLGEVMQAASAFTIVQAAFSWLVDNYPRLAEWNASARRGASLMLSIDALERAEEGEAVNRIKRGETTTAALELNNLSVALDDGTAVVDDTKVAIKKGERVLIAGESGSGKSTLVRAIAGLWPWGGGEILVQRDSRLFLLPQRPYVPTGTLRRAAAYPGSADAWTKEQIAEALQAVGLEQLKDRIEEEAPWDQTLSGGEKQRLTFARALLHNPDVIVLDEATSALDPKSQDMLMKLLSKRLPDSTLVSVGHREELEQFHSRKLVLERRRHGARLVSDIFLVARKNHQKLIRRFLRGKHRAS
ncbi:MAG: ABC transporter ATP-binding protein/permease [Pseudolabrys sp.]|nr:ABC transporter ATP-binding protein/permease [Pseudolabrys sp.]